MTPQALQKLIHTLPADSIVIDVRSKGEFAAGSISGVKNIPLSTLTERIAELRPYNAIYVMCWSGGRSEVAVKLLQAAGYKDVHNVGGVQDWIAAGYPVVAGQK